jgi:hypothetical protein
MDILWQPTRMTRKAEEKDPAIGILKADEDCARIR